MRGKALPTEGTADSLPRIAPYRLASHVIASPLPAGFRSTDDDVILFRHCARLFGDFVLRRRTALAAKIRADQLALPMARVEDQFISLLETNQVVIVAGDTGCGKSTQVPQFLLRAGYGKIACTQPRRIACQALAERVR